MPIPFEESAPRHHLSPWEMMAAIDMLLSENHSQITVSSRLCVTRPYISQMQQSWRYINAIESFLWKYPVIIDPRRASYMVAELHRRLKPCEDDGIRIGISHLREAACRFPHPDNKGTWFLPPKATADVLAFLTGADPEKSYEWIRLDEDEQSIEPPLSFGRFISYIYGAQEKRIAPLSTGN